MLDEKELFWINYFQSTNVLYGYNIRLEPTSNRGLKWSDEHREKMNKHFNNPQGYWKNHIIPDHVRERARIASKNRVWTEEERLRQSIRLTGTKVKDTSKMKIAQTGEGNNSHKLTEAEVIEIINLLNGGYKAIDIARVYGVCFATISAIKLKRSWKHINRQQVLNVSNMNNGLERIKKSGENIEPKRN